MIIRPFNAAHLLLLALAAGAVVLLWVLLRGQPERCRRCRRTNANGSTRSKSRSS